MYASDCVTRQLSTSVVKSANNPLNIHNAILVLLTVNVYLISMFRCSLFDVGATTGTISESLLHEARVPGSMSPLSSDATTEQDLRNLRPARNITC